MYHNINIEDIFKRLINRVPDGFTPAMLWVEAENIICIRTLIIEWFFLLENGDAVYRFPDPLDNSWDDERVDKFLSMLEKDFLKERYRWKELDVNLPPGFLRLSPVNALAFAQEVSVLILSEGDIEKRAWERLKNNEKIPPQKYMKMINALYGQYIKPNTVFTASTKSLKEIKETLKSVGINLNI